MTIVYPTDPFEAAAKNRPFQRTVGHECEYGSQPRTAQTLAEAGLATPPLPARGGYIHQYRCSCDSQQEHLIHPTADSSAPGGEYIIGGKVGVVFGNDIYMEAITAMSDAATAHGCDTSARVGMHTHVGCSDLTMNQLWTVLFNYLAMQESFLGLARMGADRVRSNSCTNARFGRYSTALHDLPNRSENLAFRGPTIEFRVWNSTTDAWRMYLAGAVSSALVEASKNGKVAEFEQPVEDFLFDYLTDDVVALIDRQREVSGEPELLDELSELNRKRCMVNSASRAFTPAVAGEWRDRLLPEPAPEPAPVDAGGFIRLRQRTYVDSDSPADYSFSTTSASSLPYTRTYTNYS